MSGPGAVRRGPGVIGNFTPDLPASSSPRWIDGHLASHQDVLAVDPVLRRVIAGRVFNPADVDDLVHDGLERLLKSRHRLASEAFLPMR
jgi:hypothetical protein